MAKTLLFLLAFCLVIFLFQENSYGFIEGFDSPPLPDFEMIEQPGTISVDLSPTQNVVKRYLVFGSGELNNAYDGTKNLVYGINSGSEFFSVGIFTENEATNLKLKGYSVIADFPLDFYSKYMSTNAITKTSQVGNIANSEFVHNLYNVTGKGVTIAIMDTGVDFSNPDMTESLARDENNHPIMLDPDGQGLVLTNSTFAVKINKYGTIKNFTKGDIPPPENVLSTAYVSREGVFLNNSIGNGTLISMYNSLYPYYGQSPVLTGKILGDMKVGKNGDNFIPTKSGIYHLGIILAPQIGKLQAVIVLVTDPNEAGVYDTIIPDMSTAWKDFTKEDGIDPDYDFDFTDETPIVIGTGKEFLLYDYDDDGSNDYSVGTVGARVVDVHGVFSNKAELDDQLQVVNGTLLPAMDKDGMFFGMMTDFAGHGTASSSTIVSKGIMKYDIYNDTKKYSIKGIAPDAKILPIKALWFGDVFYGWMWAAGFENENDKWVYTEKPKADIISNSWGVSSFPSLGYAPGLDISSNILNALVIPQSLHENYTGITFVSAAGNSGHGYGTIGMPGISSFGISAGAVSNNDFVGYGPFKGEPRFGNTTDNSDHVVDFSSRGPGVIGDPKPDLMSIGAYSFVPSTITTHPDSAEQAFDLFGGTSMSAPIVAGSAALLVESFNEKEESYDPFAIRNILMSTASDLQNDPLTQGAGLVNALDAVRVVNGHGGKFIVHNDKTFSNIKNVIDTSSFTFNPDLFEVEEFSFSNKTFPITGWYGGRLNPGEESSTIFTIENPTPKPLNITIKPTTLKLIENLEISGKTEPHQQDSILKEPETYSPNYVQLSDVLLKHGISNQTTIINPDSSLMILNLHFPFDNFMNQTDITYADDLQISSLYVYDWNDQDGNDEVSSDEISLVSRGGSWGTVQEIRISDPVEKFENEPVIGIYPVPDKYSFWQGKINQNATSMEYTLSTNYYQDDNWDGVSLEYQGTSGKELTLSIPPNDSVNVSATLSVPLDEQTGVYQGFLNFKGDYQEVTSPVSYVVLKAVDKETTQFVISGSSRDNLYGNGYVKGAFDMTGRYISGDWRHYYFDIQDHTINAATIDFEWENANTNFTAFMIDPQGKIIQTNFPSGVFGEFLGWPTTDWLGTSPFSQGGAFYPVKNKDNTSTVLYAPINQTGTYTLLVHSTLFDGKSSTEPISLAAKFATILPDDKPPEIILELPELINNSFKIMPEIIEKNLDFVKYYIDGQEIEPDDLQTKLLSDGKYDLRIYARDIVENEVDKTFSFIVDNTPPKISIKSPENNTTVSHSLQIDFKVEDANLSDTDVSNISILAPGEITIFPLNGSLLKDVNSYSFDTAEIDDGAYKLVISATDMIENEQTKTILFTVDHAFTQASPVVIGEKQSASNTILMIIIAIAAVAGIIIFIVKKTRKTSTTKILKEDL
ncbi:Extracellular subtilisin-like protease protein [Marine Group I thaumarchaeote SCGC AAA799-D07]|nr:Extracellular subtilisin-like protease protein [Marine Group I thaumarchaeote SCGC AAA799-D07]